jgi:tetratricopeptide (TPR) repeat protein
MHVDRVTDRIYELLLLRADYLTRWKSKWPEPTREARLQEQCGEALMYLDKAITFHSPSRGYYWLMANCAFIRGDLDREARLRKTALETPPHDAAELFYINRDHWWGTVSKNRPGYPKYAFQDCLNDYCEMLRLDPTYYNAMFFLAMRLDGQKRYDEALIAWYACTMVRPNDYIAILNRANTQSNLGNLTEAKADIESALAGAAESAHELSYAAALLSEDRNKEIRDGKRAVELAKKACKLTNYQEPEFVHTLAVAYAEVGDFGSAIKWCEAAAGLSQTWKRDVYVKHVKTFRQHKTWWKEDDSPPKDAKEKANGSN